MEVDSEMNLSEQETAYIRRFCFEVWERIDGPDTTIGQCPGHYYDLADLATVTGIQYEIIGAAETGNLQEPPIVPFPWQSLDHLHQRAQELQLLPIK